MSGTHSGWSRPIAATSRKLLRTVEPQVDRQGAGKHDHDPEMNPPERPARRGPVLFQSESDDGLHRAEKKCIGRGRLAHLEIVPPEAVWETSANAGVGDLNGDGHLGTAACHENLGCVVHCDDGKGNFAGGIRFDTPKSVPYSVIAADLNRDRRRKIVVGYVNATGSGRLQRRHRQTLFARALRRRPGSDLWHGGSRSGWRWMGRRRGGTLRGAVPCYVQPSVPEINKQPGGPDPLPDSKAKETSPRGTGAYQ